MNVLHEIIFRHLNGNYKLELRQSFQTISDEGVKTIYDHKLINNYHESIEGYDLAEFISETFGTEIKEAIDIIKDWLFKCGMDKDDVFLNTFQRNNLVFPIVERVAARTLAMDLVSVQASTSPVSKLLYMDFVYGDKKLSKWKRFWNKCWMRIKKIFINKKV
tara:strand:- start:298 stop:783 length:486 start_codon:yes stop_codon:yes gene_type:complete